MSANREHKSLSPEEKAFVDRVADLYAPPALTPSQRAAFDRTLEARLSRHARLAFLRPASLLAACAAVFVWFSIASHEPRLSGGGVSSEHSMVAKEADQVAEEEATLLTYAYYDAEFYEEESEEEEDFLSDEYEALATAFGFSDA